MQLIKPGTNFNFMGRVPLFGGVSIGLILLSIVGIVVRGFNWGIDFSGGTELQIRFEKPVPTTDIRRVLGEQGFDKNQVQPYGAPENNEFLVRIERISSLAEDRVAGLRQQALDEFGADKLRSFVFLPEQGDRIVLDFLLSGEADTPPAEEGVASATAEHAAASAAAEHTPVTAAALAKSDREIASLTERVTDFFGKAGLSLREQDAVHAGAVRQDRVELTVYFKGVADRIVQSMSAQFGQVENRRTDYVDSNVSKELRTDGMLAIVYALLGILIYVAFRFNFYFSPGAVVALVHDITITMGVLTWTQLEFNLTTVAALLTIVGYSLNDTIVVYDRIRETVPAEEKLKEDLSVYVNRAINDTLSRTLLTSITTLLVITALLVFATGVIQNFGIALCIGVLIGTYSSVFVASPVYLMLKRAMPAGK